MYKPKYIYFIIVLLSINFVPVVVCQQNTILLVSEETPIVRIPLKGRSAERQAEFSGLAWYGDYLVMLPQYPDRYENHFFIIHQNSILGYLQNRKPVTITPSVLPVNMPDFSSIIPGYEGLEAIDFLGNQVYITIESESDSGMMGYLITGIVSPGLGGITLNINSLKQIQPQTQLPNFSEEALIVIRDTISTIYEINSAKLNNRRVMHAFSADGIFFGEIPFPSIEYRVTDATHPDAYNRFWVINYLWPGDGDDLDITDDPLFLKFGKGTSHLKSKAVERLLQLEYTSTGVMITDTPPILIQLEDGQSRNWEGIVQFHNLGFLLVTDKFPETILAFLPYAIDNQR